MLFPPPGVETLESYPAIAQEAAYHFDGSAFPALKVIRFILAAVKVDELFDLRYELGTAFPGDATLAKPAGMRIRNPNGDISSDISVLVGGTELSDTFGTLPSLAFLTQPPGGIGRLVGYVIPFSAAINPQGYTYQTFGGYGVAFPVSTLEYHEGYFSAGMPTRTTPIPTSGTASYAGRVQGSLLVSSTRDPADTTAVATVTVNFAARTVRVVTSGTTSLSNNAAAGTLPAAAPQLNFTGTLTYAAGRHTFSGTVTAGNGMTGNVTGRFYGPGIAATTASKAVGSPPEVGGTFAMFVAGVGAMQGAFGSK